MKQPKTAEPVTQFDTTYRRVLDFRHMRHHYHGIIWRSPQAAYQAARHVAETVGYSPAELARLISSTPERFGPLNGKQLPFYGPTRARHASLSTATLYPAVVYYLELAEREYRAEHGHAFQSES